MDIINVGVAQMRNASAPSVLRTILGSCVATCIYDRMKKIGGLAHILLPENHAGDPHPEKYADTAIPLLANKLLAAGARKEFLSAKIVGGSSMFKIDLNITLGRIGEKNIECTREALRKLGIAIVMEDVGGSSGRVVDFFLEDGRLKVKTSGEEKIYYKV